MIRHLKLELHAALLSPTFHHCHDRLDDLADLNPLLVDFVSSGFDLRYIQDVVDEVEQVLSGLIDV